jgi:hypothetical protein
VHVVMNHSRCNTGINHETDVIFGVGRFLKGCLCLYLAMFLEMLKNLFRFIQ